MADAFGKFKTTLSEDLTICACRELCTYFGVTPARTESILSNEPRGLAFLNQLESESKLAPNNLQELHDALIHINMVQAARKVEQFARKTDQDSSLRSKRSEHQQGVKDPLEERSPRSADKKITDDKLRKTKNDNMGPNNREPGIFYELLAMSRKNEQELNIQYSMRLDDVHVNEDHVSPETVVLAFLNHLMSYDYRAVHLMKDLRANDNFMNYFKTSIYFTDISKLSCRDTTYAILNHCNPFLLQDVLTKISLCQLAVPILLPNLHNDKVVLLLWGLQNIKKAWLSPTDPPTLCEEAVVKYPFPVITFMRFGKVIFSKSNLLNKILGQIQGNDEHSYFLSSEQDSRRSHFSNGTVEALWFFPNKNKKKRDYSLHRPTCFLNLHGNAEEYSKQRKFVSRFSLLTIVFVRSTELESFLATVKEVVLQCRVILVVSSEEDDSYADAQSKVSLEMELGTNATLYQATGLNMLDIGEHLCREANHILLQGDTKSYLSIEESLCLCKELEIEVDMMQSECCLAKESADLILTLRQGDSKTYKSEALPLHAIWKMWSEIDKDRSWNVSKGNQAEKKQKQYSAKEEQRKKQRETGMSKEIELLFNELLKSSKPYKHFLVFWIQYFLNERSIRTLKPLYNSMECTRKDLRDVASKITTHKRLLENTDPLAVKDRQEIKQEIQNLSNKEAALQTKLLDTTKEFDACSVGFEHFIREFGQLYECYYNELNVKHRSKVLSFVENINERSNLSKSTSNTPYDKLIENIRSLPTMIAEMLLNGQPIEIFDGDTCNVPVKWVQGILAAVRNVTGDCDIYVISVIGIQSSGKSTLLNSMFGVRFAVSAGRCTRGVFLQLLPVADNLKRDLGCSYIAVIDTEGLKAPEKVLTNRKNEDNELATFALCLSDMTLINIGGQTVGEDLSNILQISAHALIRMKEVQLSSSCYLIQQFVSDVTASQRNQSSTQSILQTLDKAVLTAAKEEGRQDQYRQFSDCFTIVNIDGRFDSVQYVPPLWRTAMSAPNHEYSETILQLKASLLEEITKHSKKQKISKFENRIKTVWDAVKKEDFVFNFRNTTEIAKYNEFTNMYKREEMKLTKEMLTLDLDARQEIKNTTIENMSKRKNELSTKLKDKLNLEIAKLGEHLEKELKKKEYESVRHHASFFTRDLHLLSKQKQKTIEESLDMESSIKAGQTTKEEKLLPEMKAKLRQHVLPVAEKLMNSLKSRERGQNTSLTELQRQQRDDEIDREFNNEWSKQMKSVQHEHSTESEDEIKEHITFEMFSCIKETTGKTGLSKEIKKITEECKLFEETFYRHRQIKTLDDVATASKDIKRCSDLVSRYIKQIQIIAEKELAKENFLFSAEFVKSFRPDLSFLKSVKCTGCKKEKVAVIVCVVCKILFQAHEKQTEDIVSFIMESEKILKQLGMHCISTESNIIDNVKKEVQSQLQKSSRQGIFRSILKTGKALADNFLSLWNSEDATDNNFHNELQRKLFKISQSETGKWYSPETTRIFIEKTIQLLDVFNLPGKNVHQRLQEACSFYVQEAVKSERRYLQNILPSHAEEIKSLLKVKRINILDQKNLVLEQLKDVLPDHALCFLESLDRDDIKKYSEIPLLEDQRHVLDKNFMLHVPQDTLASKDKCRTFFTIIADSQASFLTLLQNAKVSNANLIKFMIENVINELRMSSPGFDNCEQAFVVCFMCSWALPICQEIKITFVREHSMKYLLEQEKERLKEEFKSLCEGACRDQLDARSFASIIVESLKEALKNKLCSTLYERLSTVGDDLFCNRKQFLKVMLEQLCEDEDFSGYTDFLQRHNSFIEKWTLKYIASYCCNEVEKPVDIHVIGTTKIGQLLEETEACLNESVSLVKKSNRQDWLALFTEQLKDNVKITLNEERLSEFRQSSRMTNIDIFADECIKVIKNSTGALENSIKFPDKNDLKGVQDWLEALPTKIHAKLANSVQGCGSNCPYCKAYCEHTIKEHSVHKSSLHLPQGMGGYRYHGTGKLVQQTCTVYVASETQTYYNCKCGWQVDCYHTRPRYKDYKKYYPDWKIEADSDYEPTLYWKWVLARFNKNFAEYYSCNPADITWKEVTKGEALTSIRSIDA